MIPEYFELTFNNHDQMFQNIEHLTPHLTVTAECHYNVLLERFITESGVEVAYILNTSTSA